MQAARRTATIVRRFASPRFVTLTLKHTDTPLAEQLDRLHASLRTLRNSKMWRAKVAGGIHATEVTFNAKAERWHPHLHIITTGRFIPWPVLKAEWLKATGDSDIVQIKMVHDRDVAANYVARYVGKPVDSESWPPARIREYANAMKGRRLLQPFGVAMKAEVDDDEPEALDATSSHLVDAARLTDAAEAGHEPARRAADILARHDSAIAAILLQPRCHGDEPQKPTAAELDYAIEVCRVTHDSDAAGLTGAYAALPPPPERHTCPNEPANATAPPSSA